MHAVHEVDAVRFAVAQRAAQAVLNGAKQRPQQQQASSSEQMTRFLSSMAKKA